jgi:hypothetical protein
MALRLTLIFADIFQGEGQSGVLPLHDAYLSERTFSYHAEEFEVIEVYCRRETRLAGRR